MSPCHVFMDAEKYKYLKLRLWKYRMDGSNLCLITFHASVRLPAAISVEKRFFLPSAPFPNARTSLNAARERIFTPPHRNMCASIRTIVCNNINTIATGLKAFIYHVQSTREIMAHCSPLYFPWLLPHTHTHTRFFGPVAAVTRIGAWNFSPVNVSCGYIQ